MKKSELERLLRGHGCKLEREGGSHFVWINVSTDFRASVPRHRELKRGTVVPFAKN
jgi:predicted RNA binding protein YcfA (HicA-like mRNA interferase family)